MTQQDMMDILEVGMRAISTCNNQPWRFRIHDEELHLFMLRTKNFFLKLEGNTWIELGSMLENLSVGAAAKGYKIEYRLFERCGLDEPAAILNFIPGAVAPVDLEAVKRRCTNRAPYSEEPLAADVQKSVLAACDVPDIEIKILAGRKKNHCGEILNNLENVRLGNRLLMEEVFPYIRVDEQDIQEHRDKLDVRTLELKPRNLQMLKFAKQKKNTKLASLFFKLGRMFGIVSKKDFEETIIQSGAMIAFLLKKRDQQTYVNLGRVSQRILNMLAGRNIQTYTLVSGLYLLDLLRENLEIYSTREQLLLLRYQYDLHSLFDFTDSRISLFIRAGYADPPKFRTLRKNVRDVMIDEKGNSPVNL